MIQKRWKRFQSKKKKNEEITKWPHAFKGYTSSYNVEVLNSYNPVQQLKDNESAIKNKLEKLFSEFRGFKFLTTPVLELKKIEKDNKPKYDTCHSHSKAEAIINVSDIDEVFESIYTTIIPNIQNF